MKVWKDDLAVKSMDWSSRGHGFDSQCPQGGSQPSLAPVPQELTRSSGLCGY